MPALPLLMVGMAALATPKVAPEPIAAVPATPSFSRACKVMSVCLLASTVLFAISATHDYFNWNRARWAALNELMAGGKATPEDAAKTAEAEYKRIFERFK